ncbi:MAG: carboxypeptidase-like regulatory domain-containing protein [Sphingobacteriales bacterium]|nr:carboxypeptidase-like regulatory domain-containing protein [Sphingobacteriales bacterium]
MSIKKNKLYFTFILSVIASSICFAQQTEITGTIKDAKTLEPIPFASVFFAGSQIGTTSDVNGKYKLETTNNYSEISVNFVGYSPFLVKIIPNKIQKIDIFLKATSQILNEISVSSKRKHEKYKNKDNPAVELIRHVIANRDANKLGSTASTSYQEYEKVIFYLSNFSNELKKKFFFKKYQFMFQDQDSSKLGGKNILPFYISEKLANHYLKSNPNKDKTIILAEKNIDFSKYLDDTGINAIIQRMYQSIDIYENNIDVMSKQFLSPIANMAPTFYKYYITDTLKNQTPNLIALNFEARNPNDLLFDGILYVTLDGRYAVKKAKLAISKSVNINYVRSLSINLSFDKDSLQHYYLSTSKQNVDFGLFKDSGTGITGERYLTFKNYAFNKSIPDSVFKGDKIETLADASKKKADFWIKNRTDTLTKGQAEIYHNMDTLQSIPSFKRKAEIASVLFTGFKTFKYFEIGPVETFNSFNRTEGMRLRLGGRTTPNFSKSYYLENYYAYGFKDHKLKFYLSGTYSLNHQSIYQFPHHYIKVGFLRDTKVPGEDLFYNQEGSLFLSFRRGINDLRLYNDVYKVEYEREFKNHFSYNLSFTKWTESPTGGLVYNLRQNNNQTTVSQLLTTEIALNLRYAPNEKFYQGKTTRTIIFSTKPVFNFNYTQGIAGLIGGEYTYSKLSFSINKKLQFSQLGRSTMTLKAGAVLGKAPFPLLDIHRGNQTFANLHNSYNLMNFLEFVSDHYVSFKIEHNFNGFFLNKIPLIKALDFREIVSFKGIYGGLSDQNNPSLNPNLIQFPIYKNGISRTYTLNKGPYIEGSVGVDNIFKIFRVDLIKRFTYLNNPQISTIGIRVSTHFGI